MSNGKLEYSYLEKLSAYLKNYQGVQPIALTFAEIEAIIDTKLPHKAKASDDKQIASWWHNKKAHKQSAYWKSVGYRTIHCSQIKREEKVYFEKINKSETAAAPPSLVRSNPLSRFWCALSNKKDINHQKAVAKTIILSLVLAFFPIVFSVYSFYSNQSMERIIAYQSTPSVVSSDEIIFEFFRILDENESFYTNLELSAGRVAILNSNYEMAVRFFSQAIELLNQNLTIDMQAFAYAQYALGVAHNRLGNITDSVTHLMYAAGLAQDFLMDELFFAQIMVTIGMFYTENRDYENAIQFNHQAIEAHAHLTSIDIGLVIAHYNLAMAYWGLNHIEDAMNHFEISAELIENNFEESTMQASIHNNAGIILSEWGLNATASNHFLKAVTLFENLGYGDSLVIAPTYVSMGAAIANLASLQTADFEATSIGLQFYQQLFNEDADYTLEEWAELTRAGFHDTALNYFERALAIFERENFVSYGMVILYENLAKLHSELENEYLSLEFSMRAEDMRDMLQIAE